MPFAIKPVTPTHFIVSSKMSVSATASAAMIQKPFRSEVLLLINNSAIIKPSAHLIFFRKIKAFHFNCTMSLNTVIGNNTALNVFFFSSYRFPKLLIAM